MAVTLANMKTLRLQAGHTQEVLAEMSGLSPRTIQRIESGKEASLDAAKSIASALACESYHALTTEGAEVEKDLTIEVALDKMGLRECIPSDELVDAYAKVAGTINNRHWLLVWRKYFGSSLLSMIIVLAVTILITGVISIMFDVPEKGAVVMFLSTFAFFTMGPWCIPHAGLRKLKPLAKKMNVDSAMSESDLRDLIQTVRLEISQAYSGDPYALHSLGCRKWNGGALLPQDELHALALMAFSAENGSMDAADELLEYFLSRVRGIPPSYITDAARQRVYDSALLARDLGSFRGAKVSSELGGASVKTKPGGGYRLAEEMMRFSFLSSAR